MIKFTNDYKPLSSPSSRPNTSTMCQVCQVIGMRHIYMIRLWLRDTRWIIQCGILWHISFWPLETGIVWSSVTPWPVNHLVVYVSTDFVQWLTWTSHPIYVLSTQYVKNSNISQHPLQTLDERTFVIWVHRRTFPTCVCSKSPTEVTGPAEF